MQTWDKIIKGTSYKVHFSVEQGNPNPLTGFFYNDKTDNDNNTHYFKNRDRVRRYFDNTGLDNRHGPYIFRVHERSRTVCKILGC